MKTDHSHHRISNASFAISVTGFVCLIMMAARHGNLYAQETATASENQSAATEDLPSGEEVMAGHIASTGGQAAYDALQNRVSESTLEIVGQGVSLELTTYNARPNKVLVKIESELTGKIEKGCDGSVVWENTLIGGPVVRDGAQRSWGLRESTFERFIYWQSIYDSAECVARAKLDDADCYEVVLTPKVIDESVGEEHPMRLFIDAGDYMIRKIEATVATEFGDIPVVAYPEDYREVDGIMMAHRLRMELMGQKRVVTVNSVQHNVDLPDDTFELPEEVQQLLK